ncbi:hypothetical protein TP2_01990 [Thioclava pacifica DSM 10166]|uniref:DUF1284 domain-containing protein n=2 Tax=Thioclava pacifica TaxID=285109 RepID=A0A074JFB5_9RHOB|nr:DUF1284 domain-containing protein [Thioclava pacifica]KEO56321.1 hypothetical protein TP2_01990 [Thioclava pacifica DSM 10166]
MCERLKFRPHHFLCSLGFEGKGYSEGFTANMSAIVGGRLRRPDGEDVKIEVVAAADDICAPCPSRRGALCVAQDRIARLDAAHARALEVAPGDVLRWGEALDRMAALPAGALNEICSGCQWLAGGMCAKALDRLKADR